MAPRPSRGGDTTRAAAARVIVMSIVIHNWQATRTRSTF